MTFQDFVTAQEVKNVCIKYGVEASQVVPFLKELIPLLEELK